MIIQILKHSTQDTTSISLFKAALEQAALQGVTTGEMRARIKVLDKMEQLSNDATTIDMEEKEREVTADAFSKAVWGVVDKFILDVEDTLKQSI
jgi:hypothetical protein